MAKKDIEIRECDRCGKDPAHTWLITGPEGAVREIELCERHAAPVANAFALARPVARGNPRRPRAAKVITLPAPPPEPQWR